MTPLRRKQTVWVRSLDEILAGLDKDGKVDGLPFMPEMAAFCGKSFEVTNAVTKTCVEGHELRGMANTVFLDDVRCDGSAHGGCQRACRIFWRDAWLTDRPPAAAPPAPKPEALAALHARTRKGELYSCQSTDLGAATVAVTQGSVGLYLGDVRAGEMTALQFAGWFVKAVVNRALRLVGLTKMATPPRGTQKKTPGGELDLQPGEWVEVKSRQEIEATLNEHGKNQGLTFDLEMTRHCGRRFRVASRLDRIIAEETGKMIPLKHTVLLEGIKCVGVHSMGCPRQNFLYFREIWLKRVGPAPAAPGVRRSAVRVEA